MKGIFITFEGPDGSGKTTQMRLLSEYCGRQGWECVLTREPGGTPISEQIRNVILDTKNLEMDGRCEALLYAASRAQHVEEKIRPALEAGKVVISDRFMDSSIAYQAYGRQLGDDVRIINEFAIGGVQPDFTFFLDISPEAGLRRAASRKNADRLDKEKLDFHQRVYEGYKSLQEIYKDRFVRIDASRSIEEIHNEIVEKLAEYLNR